MTHPSRLPMQPMASCLLLSSLLLACGSGGTGPGPGNGTTQTPEPATVVEMAKTDLLFTGWSESTDATLTATFPEDMTAFRSGILAWTMCASGEGAAGYDYTVTLKLEVDGAFYEIGRAFTPFGNSFGPTWEMTHRIDVTPFMGLLRGKKTFKIHYGGWTGAGDKRRHAVKYRFEFLKGSAPQARGIRSIYNSELDGNTGYRSYAFNVPGHPIEALLREKSVDIPADAKRLLLRVCITGHGHDLTADMTGRVNNQAEFGRFGCEVRANGTLVRTLDIFQECGANYAQAGTCYYNRANWCPGNPAVVEYVDIPLSHVQGGRLKLDLDMLPKQFVSTKIDPKAEGVAQFLAKADLLIF